MKLARLKEWRESHGLTQKELAAAARASEWTVARAEAGEEVRPNTARRLAEVMEVTVADLLEQPPIPLAEAPSPAGPAVVSVGATREEATEKLEQKLYAPARIAQGWHQLAQLFSDELEKVEKGDSEPSSLEILIDTLENVALGMAANVAAEKKELRARYDDEDAVRSKAVLRPAIDRLSALIGEAQQKIDRDRQRGT
jgi:transcriptional regulator with XRE-family HTH domain